MGWGLFAAKTISRSIRRAGRTSREDEEKWDEYYQGEVSDFLRFVLSRTPLLHPRINVSPVGHYWASRLDFEFHLKVFWGGTFFTAVGCIAPILMIVLVPTWHDYFDTQKYGADTARFWVLFGLVAASTVNGWASWRRFAKARIVRRINRSIAAEGFSVTDLMNELAQLRAGSVSESDISNPLDFAINPPNVTEPVIWPRGRRLKVSTHSDAPRIIAEAIDLAANGGEAFVALELTSTADSPNLRVLIERKVIGQMSPAASKEMKHLVAAANATGRRVFALGEVTGNSASVTVSALVAATHELTERQISTFETKLEPTWAPPKPPWDPPKLN